MKKKVLFILLIAILAIGLLALAGCGKKEDKKEVDETLVTINGLDFHLDTNKEFKGLKYVISKDLKEANFEAYNYIQYYYYQEDSTNLLFFRVFYYKGKNFDDAIYDLGIGNVTLVDGKNDNLEYKVYKEPREDGGTINLYFIDKDGDTYVVNFVSQYDIADFEAKVVKSLSF